MRVWVISAKDKRMVMELETPSLLLKGFMETHSGQELLAMLHEQQRWLACCCISPNAIMFTRQKNSVYSLVNHSEHGRHALGCPLYSEVKGSPKSGPTMDDLDVGELKKSKYTLLREYPKGGVSEPSNSESSSSSNPIPTMVRLLWQLWDDSFMTYFHPDNRSSIDSIYYKLKTTARKIRLGNGEHLSDNLYLGIQDHSVMLKELKEKHEQHHDRRAQALFACLAKEVSIEGDCIQVIDANDRMVIIEGVSGKPITVNKLDTNYKPLLFSVLYSFETLQCEEPTPYKYFVQPVVSMSVPMLMMSLEDRAIASEMASLIRDHYTGITELKAWFKRPLYPSIDVASGTELWPSFIATKADDNSRKITAFFYGKPNEDMQFVFDRNFDETVHIPTEEITSKEELLLHIVKMI